MRLPFTNLWQRQRASKPRHVTFEPLEVRTLLAIDLQVLDFSAPSAALVGSSQQFQVSWTVQNNGDAAADPWFWFDGVFLSDDNVFDLSDVRLSFAVAGELGLAVGETYTLQETITIPNTAAGSRYLILTVDETNEIAEDDDANNFVASPIELSQPDVDLTVESFTSRVTSVVAGQPFQLNWSIANTGADAATATRTDRVYLSTDDFFDFGDDIIFEEVRSDGVAALASVNGGSLVTIPESYPPGTYYLFVGIDEFGEQFETHDFNNGTALIIDVVDTAPDLTLDLLETDTPWTPGSTVDVTYTVSNNGSADADGVLYVAFYLSIDDTLSDDDLFLGADDAISELPLLAGNDFTRLFAVNVPGGLPGDLHLLAVVDFGYDVSELDESNNVLSTAVFVEPPAVLDLAVTDLTAPFSVLLGSTVEVSYLVTNNSTSIIATPWVDRFYLSDDATLDVSDVQVDPQDYAFTLGLGVNESELVQRSITFQNASLATGKYLLVEVGIGLNDDDTSNNVAAFQLDIVGADLDITSASAPSSVSVNQFANFSWTVTNVGTAGIAGNWQDRIILSPDPVLSQFDTTLHLEVINRPTPLAPGASYTINRSIPIPDVAAGTYYLFVRTMAAGTQDVDASNNVELLGTIEIGKPDLVISDFNAPTVAAAGGTISVTYTVTNDSDIAMGSASITDRFSLSDDTVLDINDTFLLLNFIGSDTVPLPAHGTYQKTVNLQLPAGSHGAKYLILRTNTFIGEQGETNHANNDFVHAIEVVASDLIVESVVAPASITFGTPFEVTYTVRNNGTGPTNEMSWFDRIALTSADASVSMIVSDVLITLDEPLAANATYTRTIVANLPPTADGGDYRLGVAADILDDMVELNEHNNVLLSDLLPVFLPPVPDLEVTSVVMPIEGFSGQQFALTWTVTNFGAVEAVGPWSDRVTLGGAQFVDLGSFSFLGTLAPGETVTRTEIFSFPAVEGSYFISIATDFLNDVLEGPSEDNTFISGLIDVVAPPLPDLTITNIVEPADGVFSGSTVPISFTVTNVGAAATLVPAWSDYLFISTNPNFVYPDPIADDLPIINQQNPLVSRQNLSYLEPGQSYTQTVDVTIPLAAAGTWYVYVFPNGLGNFYSVPVSLRESDRTNNLTRSDGFQVNLTPPPDLVVSQAIAPLQTFSGQPFNVQWTTTNNGPGATVATAWADRVYLSLDDVLDHTDVLLMTNTAQTDFQHVGRLEPGQSYVRGATLVLPEGISGIYHLLVVTDAANSVFEAGVEENNIGLRATTINLTPPPDLVVDLVTTSAPALAGHSIEVTYTVTNRGNTDTPTANSLDRIYLSSDTQLDGNDLQLSEVWGFTGVLPVDQSYTRTRHVLLPAGIEGEYYIIVSANSNGTIFENDRANNVLYDDISVANIPPNLVVVDVSSDPLVVAGEVATVEWTVHNSGSGTTATTRWIDKVYLSTNGTTSGGILLGYFVHTGALSPNESYTRRVGVEIPYNVLQASGIYVVTDAQVTALEASLQLPPTGPGGSVYEGTAENDNTSLVVPVSLSRNTPDLDVTEMILAPGAHESGGAVEVTWTVQNLGGRTNSDHWIDDIYLSLDQNLSADDVLLASAFHSGELGAGGSYTASRTVHLPSALAASNYYLILQVDRTLPKTNFDPLVNLVFEEFSEGNNIAAEPIQVTEALVPDLAVIAVVPPVAPLAGRLLDVSWTVANYGAATGNRSWRDAVYLSLDQFLDPATDRFLGYATHSSGLESFEQYTVNGSFAIPGGLTGPYYVFVRTDVANVIFERGNEGNNTAYGPASVTILLGQPVDFTVGSIQVPAAATIGASATIGYTITNNVNLPVPGGWTDSIYLSADAAWDAGDALFAQVPHPADLAAGESYSQLVQKPLPILAPGNYHVIIRTDVFNTVAETNDANNLGVSLDVAAVDATEIELGVPRVDGLSAGAFLLYRVEVPAGETLRFSWDSAFNNASTGLYVRYGTPPTRTSFDLQSTLHFQADHEIFVPTSKAGTYYVLVHATAGNVSGTVLVESLPFSLVAASPGQVGNAGNATIEITGALFTRGTTFELVGPGGTIHPAQLTIVENAAKAYATFDLQSKATGSYDLVARAVSGAIATLADAVEVVESLVGGQLATGINVPDFTLTGAMGNFFVTYSNTGNNDIAAPLLTVRSPTGTLFGRNEPEIAAGVDAVLYGAVRQGPAGILRPGQSVTIPFVFQTSNVQSEDYTFELFYFADSDSSPIDWGYVENRLPASIRGSENFPAIFSQLQTSIGATMGDYVRFLSRMATLLPVEAGTTTNQYALLSLGATFASAAVSTSISGRVEVDRLDVDISGRTLRIIDDVTGESALTTTLNDGSFVFPNLVAGTYRFTYDGALTPTDLTVTLLPGEQLAGVVVALEAGGTVFGTVRTDLGDTVNDSNLVLYDPDSNRIFTTRSGADGTYRFFGLPEGSYTLEVNAADRAKTIVGPLEISSEQLQYDVVLAKGATIAAQVLLAGGGSLTSEVTLRATPEGTNGVLESSAVSVMASQLLLDRLAAGNYEISILLDGYLPHVASVSLGAAQILDLGNVTLIPAASISGFVSSSDSVDVIEPYIFLLFDGEVVDATTADPVTGFYSFVNVRPGFHEIRIASPFGYGTSQIIDVQAGEHLSDVDLVTFPGGSISGQVTETISGLPLAGVSVVIYGPTGAIRETSTDAEGQYRFDRLGLGAYTVALRIAGNETRLDLEITDLDGEQVEANLSLEAVARIDGRLSSASGEPIAEGTVSLFDGDNLVTTAIVNAAGEFQFLVLSADTYTLQAASPLAAFAPATITVDVGEVEDVVLTAGVHSITVTLQSLFASLSAAEVFLFVSGSNPLRIAGRGLTDDVGTIQFANLTTGEYTVLARTVDSFGGSRTFTIDGLPDDEFEVPLEALAMLQGEVRDFDNAPVSGAFVTAIDRATGLAMGFTVSSDQGRYQIPGLLAGQYDLVVRRSTFVSSIADDVHVAGNTVVDVQLVASSSSVQGVLVDLEGQPIAAGFVQIIDAQGRIVGQAITDRLGAFVVTTVVGSELRLQASAEGRQTVVIQNMVLTAGEAVDLGPISLGSIAIATSQGSTTGTSANLSVQAASLGLVNNLNDSALSVNAMDAPGGQFQQTSFGAQSNQSGTLDDQSMLELIDLIDLDPNISPQPVSRELVWLNLLNKRIFEDYRLPLRVARITDAGPPPHCEECVPYHEDLKKAIKEQEELFERYRTAVQKLEELSLLTGWTFIGEFDSQIIVPFVVPFAKFSGAFFILTAGLMQQLNGYITVLNDWNNAATAKDWMAKSTSVAAAGTNSVNNGFSFLATLGLAFPPSVFTGNNDFGNDFGRISLKLGLLGSALSFFGSLLNDQILAKTIDNAATTDYAEAVVKTLFDEMISKLKATKEAQRKYLDCLEEPCDDKDQGGGTAGGKGTGKNGSRKDPNDIIGPEGYGDPHYVPGAQSLDYTVRFENLESATLPVQNMVITSQLDADLDFRTVRFGGFGWGDQSFQFASDKPFLNERVDLTASHGFYVDVVATLDVETGLATWTLTAIDPATGLEPLDERIGFLPPNDDAHIGEGFVTYSARPKTGLDTGAVIDAQATIIFDTEPPLDTPIWSNTLDVDAPSSQLNALPVESSDATFLLTWTADDVAGGSGLATTTILVSENGGAFHTVVVAHAALRQYLFEGTEGSSYRFFSVAEDNAGNREAAPTVADAFTTVLGNFNSPPTVVAPIADVNEDEDAADTVFDLSDVFSDADIATNGDSLTYTVEGNTNPTLVNASLDGAILTLDYLTNQHGTAIITIRATDLDGEWVEDTFLVTVDPANDKPTVATPIDDVTVDEDAPNTVIDVSGTFADVDIATNADSLTYTVEGNTNTALVSASLDGATLTLDYVANQHGTATITVRATDLDGEWVEDTFLVTVDPVNDKPTVATPIDDVTVDEDAPNTVINVSSTFADVDIATDGDSLTYTVEGNTNTALVNASLVGATLTLDYVANQHGTATITVRATDLDGEWVEDTFLVTVDPVNDKPTVATPIDDVTVDEDAPNTVIDVSGTFADVDIATDADVLTYTVEGNTNTALVSASLDGATLTLDYVANQHGTATITVRATDLDGEWVEDTFLVTVDPVNDKPTVATPIDDVTVDEDAPNTVINVSSTFADVDIATDADSLTYTVEGNTNTALVSASLVGATLTLDYVANQHGTATITVRATDEAGEWVETSFLVTVNSVGVTLPFSDNFNRANGTALGSDWLETSGNLGITNQRLVPFQNSVSTAVLADLLVADVSISADVDLSGAEVGRSIALMARSQGPGDANAYWGIFFRSNGGYAAQIYKHTGAGATALRSVSVPGPAGNLRFEVIGTTLNLYFNNTLVTSVIDDAIQSAGTAGVRQSGGALDNFAATVAVPPLSENAVLPFADNFNRADNSLFGPFWTERSGDTGVRNNAASMYASATSVVTLNGVLEADVSVSADINLSGVAAQFSSGLLARYSGPGDTNTYMARLFRSDGGSFAAQIWKHVGGQYTPLRSVFVSSGVGNLRFEVVGDQLRLYFNNDLVASTVDTSITGPGLVGMRLGGGTLDNFAAAEAVPALASDAELPFLDDFARANSSLLGEFWTERAGDLGVQAQQLVLMASTTSVATLNGVSEADIEVSATIDVTAGGNAGLLARYSGPGDSHAYLGMLQPAANNTFAAQIWKNTGSGWQNLTHSAVSGGSGVLRFLLEDTHLQLFFDDLLVGDIFDNSITTPGTVGVRQGGGKIDDFSAALPSALFDDFIADALFADDDEWDLEAVLGDLLD